MQEHGRPKAEPEQRKSVTFDEQTIITGHQYQSWLQDASDILTREKKRKVQISEHALS